MKNVVLFVCTGNSCRSPMAEGYLKKLLKNKGDVEVFSAGLAGFEDLGATQEAIETMRHHGVDISGHQSKRLEPEMVDKATLVLAMTKFHRMKILEMSPQAEGKVYLLKEFDQRPEESYLDIPDPMGHPIEDYEICFEKMKNPIDYIAEKILKNNQQKES